MSTISIDAAGKLCASCGARRQEQKHVNKGNGGRRMFVFKFGRSRVASKGM